MIILHFIRCLLGFPLIFFGLAVSAFCEFIIDCGYWIAGIEP